MSTANAPYGLQRACADECKPRFDAPRCRLFQRSLRPKPSLRHRRSITGLVLAMAFGRDADLHVHLADGKLTFTRISTKGSVYSPAVKRRNAQNDHPAGYRTNRGAPGPLGNRIGEMAGCAIRHELGRADLQEPGYQQDQEHPDVIAAKTAGKCLSLTYQENRFSQIIAQAAHPFDIALALRRENACKILAFEQAHSRPIDVEETIPPRFRSPAEAEPRPWQRAARRGALWAWTATQKASRRQP